MVAVVVETVVVVAGAVVVPPVVLVTVVAVVVLLQRCGLQRESAGEATTMAVANPATTKETLGR